MLPSKWGMAIDEIAPITNRFSEFFCGSVELRVMTDFTSTWFADTDPKTLEVYIEMYRNMSVEQRLTRMFELCEMQFAMQEANVREMYPLASEREVFLRVAARRLDRESMIKAYGWDPEQHP